MSDPWIALRATTRARIGLGRIGDALPVTEVLAFQLAHARARDAVHTPLDTASITQAIAPLPSVTVRSRAVDRETFLRRPDLGRRLDPACHGLLRARGEIAESPAVTHPPRNVMAAKRAAGRASTRGRVDPVGPPSTACGTGHGNSVDCGPPASAGACFATMTGLSAYATTDAPILPRVVSGNWDVVFVIADGLSAAAVQLHAPPLLRACIDRLQNWSVAPIVIATQARVALGDEIGAMLQAELCAVLIGERPGLSVANSLGVYLTYQPRIGRRDSERNCISNIHADGLSYDAAADMLAWLMTEARRRKLTGVDLKDDRPIALPAARSSPGQLPAPHRSE
jgi:ethanolamine ammonia-lyase small subunit